MRNEENTKNIKPAEEQASATAAKTATELSENELNDVAGGAGAKTFVCNKCGCHFGEVKCPKCGNRDMRR